MATGSESLLTARAALGATEGAATTPLRLFYFGVPANLDDSGIQDFTTIEDRRAWAKRDDLVALYNGLENNVLAFNNAPCSFQDFPWVLCTVPGIVSGAGLGAGTPTTTDTSAYTRTFTPSETVTAFGDTGGYDAHFQWGNTDLISTVGWSLPGCRCTDLTVNFNKRAAGTDTGVTWSGKFETVKTATQITAFTGTLSDRTQTYPVGNALVSYVDTTTQGSTADTNITSATWHIGNPPSWHDGMDGTGLHTSMHFPSAMVSDMTIIRKFSDTTELATYLARTTRKIRIKIEGAIIGAATAKNTLTLNFIGQPGEYKKQYIDGVLYASIPLMGVYDATLAASWSWTTINAVSTAYTAL